MLPFFGLSERMEISDTDVLIIAGDAGYVWDENYPYRVETLNQVFPGTIAFIDGNHENHSILTGLETVAWHGGNAHIVGERFFHLMRGELYSIYGKTFFTFGGARSTDKDRRKEGESWWRDEEPNDDEIMHGREILTNNIDGIDYVITHETPLFARDFISRFKEIEDGYHLPVVLDEWYRMISNGAAFKKWYFGHMHEDKLITPQLRAIHNDILYVGSEEPVKWA